MCIRDSFATLSASEFRALHTLTDPLPARRVPGLNAPAVPDTIRLESVPTTGPESELDILPDAPQQEPAAFPAEAAGALDSLPDARGRTLPDAMQQALAGLEPAPQPPAPAGEQPDGAEETRDPGGLSALPDPEQQTFAPAPASAPLRLVGEVFKTYIITEREGELCLIDKHAAHERILFEQLSEHYGNVPAQMLLVPVQVNLSAEEKQAVMEHLDLLGDAGIEAEDYGGATVLVRAVPADVPVEDVGDMLLELADRLKNGGGDALREKTEWVLHSIACRAAIKAGDRTNAREMVALAQKILDGTVPPFCPHGRPCVLKITRKELEKQFGRLV